MEVVIFNFLINSHLQISYTMSKHKLILMLRKEIYQTLIYLEMDGKIWLKHLMKKWKDAIKTNEKSLAWHESRVDSF
ncbi:hypothetical protein H5410_022774 [Solanum commersonii]|uniref:Uncharacterized protein n=1 Tax=Solanum commersonii TaxID=4109 RepID=A0A9J5ZGD9_SOLCO|nr:hypothetical protein H5410_022774 [Solanum commersonii]